MSDPPAPATLTEACALFRQHFTDLAGTDTYKLLLQLGTFLPVELGPNIVIPSMDYFNGLSDQVDRDMLIRFVVTNETCKASEIDLRYRDRFLFSNDFGSDASDDGGFGGIYAEWRGWTATMNEEPKRNLAPTCRKYWNHETLFER